MVEAEAGGVLLTLRDGVLQVEHDGVGAVDVGILDEAGLLRVHEHHGATQAVLLRLRASDVLSH